MAEPSSPGGPSARTCPECGTAVQERQRRCTNCGTSVDVLRRKIPRRTPLIAALTVGVLGAGAAVVAQAAVTDKASIDASAPADAASAPVVVAGVPLPEAKKPTSSEPKPAEDTSNDTTLEIPSVDDTVGTVEDDTNDGPDGTPTADDKKADPDDLQEEKTIKVKKAKNYDPEQRVGAEFGVAKAAIDKRSRTVWDVNVPADGQPMNVGIVLDLGETVKVSALRIGTQTPGFSAVVARADTEKIPPTIDDDGWTKPANNGEVETVSDDLEIDLTRGEDPKWARYIVVFITTPPNPTDTRVAISNLEVLP